MQVYVVIINDPDDGDNIVGIFSTKESAERCVDNEISCYIRIEKHILED